MGKSMLVLPSRAGWMVEWETGETIRIRGVDKPRRNSYETTDKQKAEAKAEEMRKAGYKNVKIMECIF